MEYLYQINPVLQQKDYIIIYGTGEVERNIFCALLQQNVYVSAFCLKEGQDSKIKKLFNKKVISFTELKEKYLEAYVIVSGTSIANDGETLQSAGIKNIVIENITLKDKGIVIQTE